VVAAHRKVDGAALRDLHARTWESPRRRVRHIAFPLRGDPADPEAVALVETRANQVRGAILSGASFAESARALSGNPETASRGGEIGWLSREEFGDPELAEFVFGLELGTLSPVYREGDYGFHLFQVVEERPARPFEEVEEELRRELLAAPPTDAEVLELETELRLRTPVRVRPQVGSPGTRG
jgi:parvulin-like peptidyl-prolyl isomerase